MSGKNKNIYQKLKNQKIIILIIWGLGYLFNVINLILNTLDEYYAHNHPTPRCLSDINSHWTMIMLACV